MFADRHEAGERLAEAVANLRLARPVVLALPRGGVPVAAPVADRLDAPLDLVMVRKIGVPGQPELAAGAVVDGAAHHAVFNEDILRHLGLDRADFDAAIGEQLALIEARRATYLGGRAPLDLHGRDLVVVDDGIATGATVRAALAGLGDVGAASITLAVPIAPAGTAHSVGGLVDTFVCLLTPEPFHSVGAHYRQFGQTSDAEVVALLRARRGQATVTRG